MSRPIVPFATRIVILVRSRARVLAVVLGALGLYGLSILLRLDGVEALREFVAIVSGGFAIAVPLVFAGTCSDLDHGVGAFWLQKPVSPPRFYMARLGEAMAVSLGLSLVLIACLALTTEVLDPDYSFADNLRNVPRAASWAVLVLSVGFGLSSWLSSRGAVATLALVLLTFVAEIQSAIIAAPEPPSVGLLQRLLLPYWAIRDLPTHLVAAAPSVAGSVSWIIGYSAFWVGIGLLGVRYCANGRLAPKDA